MVEFVRKRRGADQGSAELLHNTGVEGITNIDPVHTPSDPRATKAK